MSASSLGAKNKTDDMFRFRNDHYSPAIPKDNLVDEPTIDAACPNGQHPGRNVADMAAIQPGVAGRGGSENTMPHGVEGADGAGVHEVLWRDHIPDGERDDVDAIGDGVVKGSQDVGVVAAPVAHLVDGEPGARHGTTGSAGSQSTEAHVVHCSAGRDWCCVAAVATLVQRRQAGAVIQSDAVDPSSNDFTACRSTYADQPFNFYYDKAKHYYSI